MKSQNRWLIIGIAVVLLAIISAASGLYIDWLWFDSLNISQVFTTTLLTKWGLGIGVTLIAFGFLFANLMLARRYLDQKIGVMNDDGREIIYEEEPKVQALLQSANVSRIFAILSAFVAVFFGIVAADKWIVFQQFLNKMTFNINDPIFNRDVGFYIFDLRFYEILYGMIMPLLVFTVLMVGSVYLMMAAFRLIDLNWREINWPKAHIISLLGIIMLCKSWGYRLATFSILYSDNGVVYGAGYTDVHARILAYKVLAIISLLVAALLILNLFIRKMNWVLMSLGLWVGAAVILVGVYPGIVQKFSVVPNEFNREQPYIQNNINFTRAAYGLDKAEDSQYDLSYDLTWEDIQSNQATIQNIRLWDWQPFKQTYQAIQEIRPYYKFNDIDIDRYIIDGEYRQVMLAPRELSQESIPQTWVNTKLYYTHGYGVSMSPVNEVTREGLPVMFIKDIPPKSSVDLKVTRPEIYYGEEKSSYVIVNSNTMEFDYPMENKNAESTYKADSGVKMGSIFRRCLLAWELRDYKLLLSNDINSDSQVLMHRNIQHRVSKIAPFLQYDGDPYMVVDEGNLYWMIDAYTTSENYPYSEPFDGRKNYIRNSVKIVVNAYSGDTTFYLADENDPVIASLSKIFPNLLKPLEEMSDGMKSHIRYPEDLFTIQANMYTLYHMTEPVVFYNKEDRWNIPQEIIGEETQKMEPYYIIMQLPDEDKPEYIMMMPFTPNAKQNMIGWLCARSDGENYGRLKVYNFPKQELIYGPMQIESRINQNAEISEQMTLWQKSSSVYRGNLLVIPIKNSMMYVEPIYLQTRQAQSNRIPELRRIIVVYGDTVVMKPTLEEALIQIFAPDGQRPSAPTEEGPTDQGDDSLAKIVEQAQSFFDKAQNALKSGDWAGYGSNIDQVGKTLERLMDRIKVSDT